MTPASDQYGSSLPHTGMPLLDVVLVALLLVGLGLIAIAWSQR